MREDTIAERIRQNVCIHIALMRRKPLRSFTGYEVGKRRDPSCIPGIALDIARDMLRALDFYSGEEKREATALAPMIEQVLRSVPAEDAFALSTRNHELVLIVRDIIGNQVANALTAAFEIKKKPPPGPMWNLQTETGTLGGDALANLERQGQLVPRYKWRRASGPYLPDFVGFDGEMKFGRIWQDYTMGYESSWQWSCLVTMSRILNSPSRGSADIPRQAARDVEDHYDALKRLNGVTE
ncbi:hypothetical protein G6L09_05685 [Agrobacterium rhizogenes]|nr:hypothetical protein [Rhizobium rhizogenes]NTH70049.1 hypothetical protein [Rhizobium rhizogenes]